MDAIYKFGAWVGRHWRRREANRLPKSSVRFVAEQDGGPERILKTKLIGLLSTEPSVLRAYLARSDYEDGTGIHVTLALKCSCGEIPALVPQLGGVFGTVFTSQEHLDILFLGEDQETQLRQVCPAFFERM